jgi:ABC-type molybdate transport system permease subunit
VLGVNFGATLMIAGNIPGQIQTIPDGNLFWLLKLENLIRFGFGLG